MYAYEVGEKKEKEGCRKRRGRGYDTRSERVPWESVVGRLTSRNQLRITKLYSMGGGGGNRTSLEA